MNRFQFSNVTFVVPGFATRRLKGKIIWNKPGGISLEFDNTLKKHFPFTPFEVIYALTRNKQKLTLTGCFPEYSVDNHFIFSVNEVHEHEWIKNKPNKTYKSIEIELTLLTTWFKSAFRTTHLEKDSEIFRQINILKNISNSYSLSRNIGIKITALGNSNYKGNTITLSSKSTVEIFSKKPVTRNELFGFASSFLNLFSLFVRRKPYIENITLTKKIMINKRS